MFNQDNAQRDKLIFDIVTEYKETSFDWTWKFISEQLYDISKGKYKETPNACRKAYKRYCEKQNKNFIVKCKGGMVGSVEALKSLGIDVSPFTNIETDEEKFAPFFKSISGSIDVDKELISKPFDCSVGFNPSFKENDSYENVKLSKPKEKQIISVEIKQDGTQISERRIVMSETDSKSPEFCLIAHGFDPKLWEVVSVKNNFWDSAFGEGEVNTLYQSKLIVKPKIYGSELSREDIKELQKEFSYKHQPIYKIVDTGNGHHALFVEIGDLHIGLFSWGEETGENADYHIIETKFREVIGKIKKFILSHPEIDTLYLIFGGDIIHVDNEQNTTSGGTVMQFDGRAKKMVRIAYKVLSWAILELSFVKNFYVKVLEGNHGRLTEFTIFEGLKNMFSEFENIDFDNSPMARKAVLYGGDLIGLSHGELSNKKNQSWLQVEFAELWGKSKRREIHLFHLHKEESEPTEGGITIRRNPTIKPTDHYEYFNAFIGADKKIACYLYDEKDGLESINYFRSMFTR